MSEKEDISQLRQDYSKFVLDESQVLYNPIEQFKIWFHEAIDAGVHEPNAFTLSTLDSNGFPSGRTLLLKHINDNGFVFFTNYESAKANEIAIHSKVSMTFLWLDLQRQVRVKGLIEKTSKEMSKEYFHSRPIESQLGAWASPQSQVIPDRNFLEKRLKEAEDTYKNVQPIPLPEFWGGYQIFPVEIEFWQGRTARLHDRIRYTKIQSNWKIERLAP